MINETDQSILKGMLSCTNMFQSSKWLLADDMFN
jgi:hypothetical protein